MKISAFTFIRNGSLLGYPYIASIHSVLPLCDEFIIAVGNGDDDTLQQIQALDEKKIRILATTWNEKMQDRGYVYAQQKMIAQFNCQGDWAFYLEGDEVLHQQDLPVIRQTLEKYHDDNRVEALLFDYYHFYGDSQTLAISPGWYRQAPRLIRNTIRNYSPDGLFFVVMDKNKRGRYPYAVNSGAHIYHYGHIRPVADMQKKIQQVSKYWQHQPPNFKNYGNIDPQALAKFQGSHPQYVQDWLKQFAEKNFMPNPDYQPSRRERRHRWMMKLEQWFGLELSKKHHRRLKLVS